MKSCLKSKLALGLASALAVTAVLSGCGSSDTSGGSAGGDDTSFTYLIDVAPDSEFYDEYEENPVYQYWANLGWDAEGSGETKTISIDFSAPISGSEKDNLNTLLATGEYPDIFSTSFCNTSIASLYEEGIALDLTDYVEKYMPNYLAFVKENNLESKVTNKVDGESRYLQIYQLTEGNGEMWGGFEYRRDWIVKYGTNPETGEAFTGGYDADGVWSDDVVFPSGETDPIYISDWEWMLDIMDKALDAEGITDGYALSIPYAGVHLTGELVCGFGEGGFGWYLDSDGTVQFNAISDGMRAYLECMAAWYQNGWIDKAFDERTNDAFYEIDAASMYSGKVGVFWGLLSQLGSSMDTGSGDESDPLNGIYIAGAPQPINDVYGDADHQYILPTDCYAASNIIGQSIVITSKAEDKDIATLLTAIDYMYTTEGARLFTFGFSDEQQAELNNEFYNEHGLSDGAYYISTDENGTEIVNKNSEALNAEDGLATAACMNRVIGLQANFNIATGYAADIQHSVDLWTKYACTGNMPSVVSKQMTSDQASEVSLIQSQATTYAETEIPQFIKGSYDINSDEDWDAYVEGYKEIGVEIYCDYANEILQNQ